MGFYFSLKRGRSVGGCSRWPGGVDGRGRGEMEAHTAPDVRRYRAARADQAADEEQNHLKRNPGNGAPPSDRKYNLLCAKLA